MPNVQVLTDNQGNALTYSGNIVMASAPSGTKTITENGTYSVANYENAEVNVPVPSLYREYEVYLDLYGLRKLAPNRNGKMINLSGVEQIDDGALCHAYASNYQGQNALTGAIDMSDVKRINPMGCTGMFGTIYNSYHGPRITSCDLSSLTKIEYGGSYLMFYQCTDLVSCDLSSLEYIENFGACQMFAGCTSLKSMDLSSLKKIGTNSSPLWGKTAHACSYMFQGCTSLETVDMSSLNYFYGDNCCENMFTDCTSLRTVDMSSVYYLGYCYNMFGGSTNLQDVKFDSLQNLGYQGCNLSYMFRNSGIKNNPFKNVSTLSNGSNINYLFMNADIEDGSFLKLAYMPNYSGNYVFSGCTNLKRLDFPALRRVHGNSTFNTNFLNGCNSPYLTDIKFPMLTVFTSGNKAPFANNCFGNRGANSAQLTLHFRNTMQTTIEKLTNYATLWGADAIVFDLVATIIVNGINYRREGSCDENGYFAWKKATGTITLNNGNSYKYVDGGIGYFTDKSESLPNHPGAMYYWIIPGSSSYDASNSIRTPNLQPKVGDMVYEYDTSVVTPTLEVTDVSDNVFVYTPDSAEPVVGNIVYSDTQGTVLGTIDSIQ